MTSQTLDPLPPTQSPTAGSAPIARPGRRKLLRRFAILAILVVGLWLIRVPLLVGAARLWIVNDPMPDQADVIVVLGGGMNHRPLEAARLQKSGLAPKILVSYPQRPTEAQGIIPSEGELTRTLLQGLGIPPEAIEPMGTDNTSTYEEAQAARHWLDTHPAQRLVVPTDAFHTRRVKWTFERALRGSGVQLSVIPIHNNRYGASNWWRREEGLTTFQNEVIKLLYYWATYR